MIQLNRIIPSIGSAIVGSALLLGSQNIQAENKDTIPKTVKVLDAGEVNIPKEILLEQLFQKVEELFKKSVKYLSTNDPTQQTIGVDNLIALQNQLDPVFAVYTMSKLLNTKEHLAEFFNEKLNKLEKFTNEAKSTEALIKGCFLLLELSYNERNYHKKFIEWLATQAEKSINDKSKTSKEKQKILESAIREELYSVIKTSNHIELSKSLVTPYTKLIGENCSNAEFLRNGISTYEQFKSSRNKEINDNVRGLFEIIIDALHKLPINEQKELKAQILLLPQNSIFQSDNQTEQSRLVEHLSKIYSKNKNLDLDGFTQLTNSFLYRIPYFGSSKIVTKWHPYTLYKFIDDNKEYFEENINNLIKSVQNSKDEKTRIYTRNALLQTYTTFQHIPEMKKLCGVFIFIDPTLVHQDTIDELGTKVTAWYNNKLERPMFRAVLECLENETVKEATTSSGIRYIKKDNWTNLNNQLEKMVDINPNLKSELKESLIKRLENENNPRNREMIYKTITDVIYNALPVEEGKQKLPDLLKKGIKEESAYGACLIGEAISKGWYYYLFLKALEDYKTIEDLRINELSPLDKIKFDLIGIVNGNRELYKTYLPENYPFKAGKDEKVNPDDLHALLKLRENAFLALSSSNLNAGILNVQRDYDTLIGFLENQFERAGTRETLSQTWGKQSAALITLYLKHPHRNSKDFIDSKFSFLKGRFFDGIEKTSDTTIAFFNTILESEFIELSPDKNRKIIDELYRQKTTNKEIRARIFREAPILDAAYKQMRQTFALNLLTALCERDHTQFDEYKTYLQRLGFEDNEISNIVKVFISQ